MKITDSKKHHTIIFFDIRNFSEHRSHLAEHRRAKLLTDFVRDILNNAVDLVKALENEFKVDSEPILNHTGDGFMLILRGDKNPLLGLLWMSKFHQLALQKIEAYERVISGIFQGNPPKKLSFGIGAHYGLALPFYFKSFWGARKTEGFIGSALNIAARVEQCTKDHVHQVIFTGALLNNALKIIPTGRKREFDSFWTSLGEHRFRGFETPRTLYGFDPGFHQAWVEASIVFPTRFA